MFLRDPAGASIGSSGKPAQVVDDVLPLKWGRWKLGAGPGQRVLGLHLGLTRSMTAEVATAKATIANPARLIEISLAFCLSFARFRSNASKRVVRKRYWI